MEIKTETGDLDVQGVRRRLRCDTVGACGVVLLMGVGAILNGCAAMRHRLGGVMPQTLKGVEPVRGLTDVPAPGPIEIREEMYADGKTVRVRAEAYKDADGDYVLHGRLTNYWENGAKKSEVTYVHGVEHGPRTSWYQTGQVWITGKNYNGGPDGTWTVWFPNGTKAQEKHFDHGAFHGTFREWHSNGQLKREFHLVHGTQQGPEKVWTKDGSLVGRIDFVDGVMQP